MNSQLRKACYRKSMLGNKYFKCDRIQLLWEVSAYGANLYIPQASCQLSHWGRVTHICVSKLTIIGSDNALSPDRRQAIIWTNDGILLIGTLGTNFSEILIEIHAFSLKKMHLKMSSEKRRPFCLGLNVLNLYNHHQSVDVRSEWSIVTKDVPKGSILGPLLFNVDLFVNDAFFLYREYHIYNYSDDNNYYIFFILLTQLMTFESFKQMTPLFLWTGLNKVIWRLTLKNWNQCWFIPMVVMLRTW